MRMEIPKEVQDTPAAPTKARRLNRLHWIEAAMSALAEGGVAALRVEALAKRLSVTKGGFYWHFGDRADLLDAVLATWRHGRIDAITHQTNCREGDDPKAVLRDLLDLYAKARNQKGTAIELAVRDWAHRDPSAARVVAEVDEVRLERVAALFRDAGANAEEAYARAYLFYTYAFGQSLLAEEEGDARRQAARGLCAGLLVPM